jgi:hypothetical protein
MSITPKSSRPWVRALLHSVHDQPDSTSVHAQYDRILDALTEKLPTVAAHLEENRADILAFIGFPEGLGRQIWSNNALSVNRLSDDTCWRYGTKFGRRRLMCSAMSCWPAASAPAIPSSRVLMSSMWGARSGSGTQTRVVVGDDPLSRPTASADPGSAEDTLVFPRLAAIDHTLRTFGSSPLTDVDLQYENGHPESPVFRHSRKQGTRDVAVARPAQDQGS